LQCTILPCGAVQWPSRLGAGSSALQRTLVEMFGGSPGSGGMPPLTVDSMQY